MILYFVFVLCSLLIFIQWNIDMNKLHLSKIAIASNYLIKSANAVLTVFGRIFEKQNFVIFYDFFDYLGIGFSPFWLQCSD